MNAAMASGKLILMFIHISRHTHTRKGIAMKGGVDDGKKRTALNVAFSEKIYFNNFLLS